MDNTNLPGNGTRRQWLIGYRRSPLPRNPNTSVTLQRSAHPQNTTSCCVGNAPSWRACACSLARLDAPEEDLEILKRSLRQLEELFLIVVVGEFNAGKTAFLNALLGQKVLPEGVTPTTSQIHVVRHTDGLTIEPPSDDYPRRARCPSTGCANSTWSTRRAPTP